MCYRLQCGHLFHSYLHSSSERGTNEVHNKMNCRWLPKHVSLDTTSPSIVKSVTDEMNNLSRKMFAYQTPKEMFDNAILAI